ncbi:MAG: enoyl-CoA hydratase [Chloroflexota bacterium]
METVPQAVVLREDKEGVAHLWLNRPKQYNAMSEEVLHSLNEALDAIATDESIRVVVLGAKGKAFCAGHDLKQMRAEPSEAYYNDLFSLCSSMMMRINQLPQPVIARVQGLATAAGCQLVAACDLAVAADSAQFATSGIRFGLFCSTPAVAVGRNVSRKKAMEMLLTGEFMDAETAASEGLINKAVPEAELDTAVQNFVDSIMAKSAVAVRMGKEMFYKQDEMGLAQAYEYASTVMACNMMAEDALDGVQAFLDKRTPVWKHR